MHQIFSAGVDTLAGAVVLLPLMAVLHRIRFCSWKKTVLYSVFGLYLTAVISLVGIPSLYYMRYLYFDPNLNLIPFRGMMTDLKNCLLNVALFVPLGLFLPCLWEKFRSLKATVLEGFGISLFIELSQIITGRATDVNDLITNVTGTALGFLAAKLLQKTSASTGFEAKDRFTVYTAVLAVMVTVQPYISNFVWSFIL